MKCRTEAVAVGTGGAGDGGEAGGGHETGGVSASPLAGLLNDVDGVRLEGETHVDLHDAPRAGQRTNRE